MSTIVKHEKLTIEDYKSFVDISLHMDLVGFQTLPCKCMKKLRKIILNKYFDLSQIIFDCDEKYDELYKDFTSTKSELDNLIISYIIYRDHHLLGDKDYCYSD